MKYVFYKCSALENLDVSSWDTHAATDISYMFSHCNGLTTLDVSQWDTSNVTDMTDLFDSDYRLTTLDLTNWNTGNVVSMHHMFSKCSAITELDIGHWDTHSLTNPFDMFDSCRGLTSLDLSGWDTSKVEQLASMFTGCTNLKTLNLTGWDLSTLVSSTSSTSQRNVFKDCPALDELIFGDGMKYDVSDTTKFTVSEDGTVTVSSVEGVVTKDGITFDAAEDGTFDFSASEDALTATGSCTVTTPANNTYTCPESASVTKSEGGSVTVTGISGITEDSLTVAPIEDGTLTVTEDKDTGIRTVVGAGSVKTANAEFTPAENSSVVLTKNESGTTTMTGNGTLRTKDGDAFTGNNLVVTENAGDNALSVSGFDVTTTVGGMTITPGEDMVCTEEVDGSMTVTGSGTIASSDGVTYQSNAKSKFTITEPSETGEVRVNGSVTVEAGSVDAAFESGSTLTFKAGETETTVTGSAGASVTLNADGTVTAKEGTTVTGTAEAGYTASLTPTPPTPSVPPAPRPASFSVTVPSDFEGGSVTADSASTIQGSRVTLTVTPDEGYHFGSLTVTDRNGTPVAVTDNGDGTYTFTMPYGKVTVKAAFVKCGSLSFADLDVGAWYHDYTDYVINHGLMRGTGGLFEPGGTVTRAQMVTVLWNMRGKPVVNYYMTYSDVSEGVWYSEAVRWATSEGIAKGYGNGKFGPNDPISREQMAAMMYRYEQKYGDGGFTGDWMYRLPFTDLDRISDWAFEAVAWCNMRGVITGKGNGVFDPKGPAKRGELAAILTRYCGEDDTE